MSYRKRYVFVCQNRRPEGHPRGCCSRAGAEAIRMKLKELIGEKGISGDVRIIGTTCLDFCEEGAVMVVFPENVWYRKVELDDLERIVDEHLIGGRAVDDSRMVEDG